MPALPLRDLIIFPNMVVPLLVGRTRSINAVEESLASEEELLVVFQANPQIDDPEMKDLLPVGVSVKVIQSVREQNGLMKILVEVMNRVLIKDFAKDKKTYICSAEKVIEKPAESKNKENEALSRLVNELLEKWAKEKLHEATLVCRVAGVNPLIEEGDRK